MLEMNRFNENSLKLLRLLKKILFLLSFIALSVIVLFAITLYEVDIAPSDLTLKDNVIFYDRTGRLLRFIPDDRELRHLWVSGAETPQKVKQAFIAAEDGRFYRHHGFDVFAIMRAVKDNVFHGRVVSGASTITQQVVRLVYPRKRTVQDKVYELFKAVKLETTTSKAAILEQYLNRAPMGNNVIGVELASRVYFGKPSKELTVAQAALLASLPKAPERLNPYGKNREALLNRKDWVLRRMAEEGYLTPDELKDALNEAIIFKRFDFPHKAPHLVDLLIQRGENATGEHRTTIDLNLQTEVERIVSAHAVRLEKRGARQTAVLVVHNPSMEALAMVGSQSYSAKNQGFNNGAIAFRSAGSTLKPFVYAEALEIGQTPASLLQDTLQHYKTTEGDYAPYNFDRQQYGPVTMRVALGNSLNISAVKTLQLMGVERFFQLLQRIDLINYPEKGATHYGLGLVIGNPEVSLEQLVAAYTLFPNQGALKPLRYIKNQKQFLTKIVFAPQTAYIISDILSDPSARMITFSSRADLDFPFKVALKTGTSVNYRDCWIIGYTPDYTVGVWVGNFDGLPTYGLTGAEGASPIFKDILTYLYRQSMPSMTKDVTGVVRSKICGISGMKAGPYCGYVTEELFIEGTEPEKTCSFHNAQSGQFHQLPSSYAGWLSERQRQGLQGNYRLQATSNAADHEPPLFERAQGVRVKNNSPNPQPENSFSQDELFYMPPTLSNNRTTRLERESLHIIKPLPNDHFILDKRNQDQRVKLEAIANGSIEYIDWFIDGVHYVRKKAPYYAYWTPSRGRHTIIASSPDKMGASIEVFVE
jgi:penicillin-binding protein 1C